MPAGVPPGSASRRRPRFPMPFLRRSGRRRSPVRWRCRSAPRARPRAASADCGIQLRHRLDDIETRPHRSLGLVLMGARVAEIDEDAVAHVLARQSRRNAGSPHCTGSETTRSHRADLRGPSRWRVRSIPPGRKTSRSAGGARPGPAPVREAAPMLVSLSGLGPAPRRRARRWRKGACGDGRPRSRRWLIRSSAVSSGRTSPVDIVVAERGRVLLETELLEPTRDVNCHGRSPNADPTLCLLARDSQH